MVNHYRARKNIGTTDYNPVTRKAFLGRLRTMNSEDLDIKASDVIYDGDIIPVTNVLQALDWLAMATGLGFNIAKFLLTQDDIDNSRVVLGSQVADPSETLVFVKNAPNQSYGVDYIVYGTTGIVAWQGLGLDGILEVGDRMTVLYQLTPSP